MTYLGTKVGFVYTAFVTDVFSRKIVGWQTRSSMRPKRYRSKLSIKRSRRLGATWKGARASQ